LNSAKALQLSGEHSDTGPDSMLHATLAHLSAGLDWASSHIFSTLLLVIVGTFLVMTVASALAPVPKPAEYQPERCGDITKQTLRKYNGRDPFLPIYFAVRGEVFDVTKGRDFYGPGKHAAEWLTCGGTCTLQGAGVHAAAQPAPWPPMQPKRMCSSGCFRQRCHLQSASASPAGIANTRQNILKGSKYADQI
jgi:Cytochrome b5-like Heme/Steroid binding domain